jgi:hypothetical protein
MDRYRGKYVPLENAGPAFEAKIAIRRRVMDAIGVKRAHVFDAFAGAGAMYSAVWKEAAAYAGCEIRQWERDGRLMFCADNRRVMRAIDLSEFNVFDLDAFGFPWEQALIVAERRPVRTGERVAFIFTEGGGIAYKANTVPHAVTLLAGIKHGAVGLGRRRDDIFERALKGLARRMHCWVEERWQAKGKNAVALIYCGVIFRGDPKKVTGPARAKAARQAARQSNARPEESPATPEAEDHPPTSSLI